MNLRRHPRPALACMALLAMACNKEPEAAPQDSVVAQDINPYPSPTTLCFLDHLNGTVTYYYGYSNGGAAQTIPVGSKNMFTTGNADRGQPTSFPTGTVGPYPQYAVGVVAATGSSLTWQLSGVQATMNSRSSKCADAQAPTWPAGSSIQVASDTGTAVGLSWTAAQDNAAVTGYRIYQNGALVASPGNVLAATISGLSATASYTFQVQAGDAAGNWSTNGPAVMRDKTPPAVAISAPANGAKIAALAAAVSGTATDNSGTVKAVTVAVNGGAPQPATLSGGRTG